jgi:hypothetical protein
MTVVAGAVAGILGITGWRGVALYPLSQALAVPLILAKSGGAVSGYFPSWCAWRGRCLLFHGMCGTACYLVTATMQGLAAGGAWLGKPAALLPNNHAAAHARIAAQLPLQSPVPRPATPNMPTLNRCSLAPTHAPFAPPAGTRSC